MGVRFAAMAASETSRLSILASRVSVVANKTCAGSWMGSDSGLSDTRYDEIDVRELSRALSLASLVAPAGASGRLACS